MKRFNPRKEATAYYLHGFFLTDGFTEPGSCVNREVGWPGLSFLTHSTLVPNEPYISVDVKHHGSRNR